MPVICAARPRGPPRIPQPRTTPTKTHKAGKSGDVTVILPHCVAGQRAVPEQHQPQRRSVQPDTERPQHRAGRPHELERAVERHFTHDRSGDEPAQSTNRQ